jgi:dihydrolipoamide dehydrogenase
MAQQEHYDIAVLGGGPGGYPAAIAAAQTGKKVALIEEKELGGTCLNRGCIPSKALIASAEELTRVQNASQFGIHTQGVSFDYGQMAERKDKVVDTVRQGLEATIRANGITVYRGRGTLMSTQQLRIVGTDNAVISADKIIIATGSEPRNIPAFPCDGVKIIDSTSLLNLKTLPKSIAIIGGGVIGCEFASLYQAFGVDVTIVEMLPRLLPLEGEQVAAALNTAFTKRGIHIHTGAKVEGIDVTDGGVSVRVAGLPAIAADLALVAVGRSLNVQKIGLENNGIQLNEQGLVQVNVHMQTSVDNIYAVGDIASKWWLAHVASHQGVIAAHHACGDASAAMHYNAIPSAIFTVPEIGTVGLSLEDALAKGYQASIGAFPFQALGKAHATLHTDGFAQIVFDKATGQILGAQVVGYDAANLVAEMGLAITNELTIESVMETIHAHPTMAEAWMQAALVANGTPIDLPPKRKK